MSPEVRAELRTGLAVIGGCLLAAVVLAILWRSLAPLPHVVKRADGLYLTGGQDEVAIAADGWFAACAATVGLVAALVVFARTRHARLGPLLGLVVGGIAGSVVAWRLGIFLGPGAIIETAKGLALGSHFDGPLKLSARGVLFAWPLVSTVAYFALTAGLEPKVVREPQEGEVRDGQRFPVTVLRPGYVIDEVDAAFERLDGGSLSAEEMRDLRFASTRLHQGYDEASVDAAIDAAIAARYESSRSPSQDDESARPSPG